MSDVSLLFVAGFGRPDCISSQECDGTLLCRDVVEKMAAYITHILLFG